MDWKSETLQEWLSRHVPAWGTEKILNWSDAFPRHTEADAMMFVVEEHRNPCTTVDMHRVVGQWEHYAGQTWIEALRNPQYKPGKMRDVIAKANSNPAYYFSGEIKGGIQLSSTDGMSWYSNTSGNHRTVIAKFLSEMHFDKTGSYPLVAGVSTTQYVVDYESLDLFKSLLDYRKQGILVSVHRERPSHPLMFHVGDFRFGRQGKFGQLTPEKFRSFARWVVQNNGGLTRWDKLAHWRQLILENPTQLVFFT